MIDVSVIVPTYRPNQYIFECLASLYKQSFPFENFEIIIILNGEREPYYDFLQDCVREKKDFININLIYTEIAGVSNARNIGLDKAVGRYICFIDDDDIVSPVYLENLFLSISNDTIVVSNVYTFYDTIYSLGEDYITKCYKTNLKNKSENIFSLRSFLSSSCCKMIPVSIIQNRRFNLNMNNSEDALFMATISDKIKSIKLVPNDSSIYYRRIRPESASRKHRTLSEKIDNMLALLTAYWKVYWTAPLNYNFLFFLSRVWAAIISLKA